MSIMAIEKMTIKNINKLKELFVLKVEIKEKEIHKQYGCWKNVLFNVVCEEISLLVFIQHIFK